MPPLLAGRVLRAALRLTSPESRAPPPRALRLATEGTLALDETTAGPPVDPRDAVRAAGALGYRLLTNREAPGAEPAPETEGPLGDLILTALSEDPDLRFAGLPEFLEAVERVLPPLGEQEDRPILAALATLLAPVAALAAPEAPEVIEAIEAIEAPKAIEAPEAINGAQPSSADELGAAGAPLAEVIPLAPPPPPEAAPPPTPPASAESVAAMRVELTGRFAAGFAELTRAVRSERSAREADLAELARRLEAREAGGGGPDLSDLRAQVAAIATRIERPSTDVAKLAAELAKVSRRLDELRANPPPAAASPELTALREAVGALGRRLDDKAGAPLDINELRKLLGILGQRLELERKARADLTTAVGKRLDAIEAALRERVAAPPPTSAPPALPAQQQSQTLTGAAASANAALVEETQLLRRHLATSMANTESALALAISANESVDEERAVRTKELNDLIERLRVVEFRERDSQTAWTVARRVDELRSEGRYGDAERDVVQALEEKPQSGVLHYSLGRVYASWNEGHTSAHDDAARAAFNKALELAPRFAPAQAALGVLLLKQGRRRDARRRFEQALALDPTNPEARDGLGASRPRWGTAAVVLLAALLGIGAGLVATGTSPRAFVTELRRASGR